MSRTKANRREFLQQSGTVLAGASLVYQASVARMAHAAGSDVLKVALIGCGGRGHGAAQDCLNAAENTVIVAVADAFADRARGVARALRENEKFKGRVDLPDERVFVGLDSYKAATDCGVDIVLLCAPPGFRPWHYRYAIERGKHVFMEKPCCTDAPGYRVLVETNKLADQKKLKVVVGLQRRHDPRYRETIARIHDGAIGKLMYTRVYWNGSGVWIRDRQPGQTEMQYQVHNWYYFVWLSGDHICEQHIHNLDIGNWVHGGHPVEANGMGGRQVRTGARHNNNVGHIYDHHFVEFTFADGTKMFSQCRHIPNCWNNVSEHAHGTEGYSNCNGLIEGARRWRYQGPSVNPYVEEHKNLIRAILKDEPLNDGHHAADASMTAVLGRMATYSGQVVTWDEAVAKGPAEVPPPEKWTWDAEPPIKPDASGSYEHLVAMPGVYKPY
ncbi:MAG: Gfo/Idh/MocA family oxidoreductase [Thermoguttaceae bacterium]|nr:Gfo/Idh/MocA family oxidoreductase [Thermoguttaceae bacterium]MDW8077620.1 Gfo/Idh/MocA family oxidoreductase [Thermoguttaceae bacterium]